MADTMSAETRQAAGELLTAAASGSVEAFRQAASRLPADQPAYGFREPTNQRNALHVAAMSGCAAVCEVAISELGFQADELDKEGVFLSAYISFVFQYKTAHSKHNCHGPNWTKFVFVLPA
eukprot:scaffold81418_cov35-Prasinocladus_malaysianus.AAC.1